MLGVVSLAEELGGGQRQWGVVGDGERALVDRGGCFIDRCGDGQADGRGVADGAGGVFDVVAEGRRPAVAGGGGEGDGAVGVEDRGAVGGSADGVHRQRRPGVGGGVVAEELGRGQRQWGVVGDGERALVDRGGCLIGRRGDGEAHGGEVGAGESVSGVFDVVEERRRPGEVGGGGEGDGAVGVEDDGAVGGATNEVHAQRVAGVGVDVVADQLGGGQRQWGVLGDGERAVVDRGGCLIDRRGCGDGGLHQCGGTGRGGDDSSSRRLNDGSRTAAEHSRFDCSGLRHCCSGRDYRRLTGGLSGHLG